jgi:hypothetical protein
MKGKKLLLSINPEVYALLQKKAKPNLMTVQQLIADILRKNVLPANQEPVSDQAAQIAQAVAQQMAQQGLQPALPVKKKKSHAGRPKHFEFEDYFSRPTRESRKIERAMGR